MNTALSDFAEKATAVAVIETEQAFVDDQTLFVNSCDGLWATSSFCLDEVPTDGGDGDATQTVTDDGDAADSGDAGDGNAADSGNAGDSGTTDGGDTGDSGTTDGGDAGDSGTTTDGDAGDGGDTGDAGDDNAADAGDGTG